MSEFKILGGTDPASQSLGDMTQGIGYPLRPVEPAVSGGAVTVKSETVFTSSSYDDQNPLGLGITHQIVFGPADANTYFSIDGAGATTCLMADEYTIRVKLTMGREGANQVSQLYVRALINGVQTGDSIHTIIDNPRIEIPQIFEGTRALEVGDVVTLELIRDTDGVDAGGLRAGIPDVVGWAESPSAAIQFMRAFATVTTE